MSWIHIPITVVILLGYLGVAYITHATQGFYSTHYFLSKKMYTSHLYTAYSFLDPHKEGKKLAVFIVGIGIGQIVIFLIVRLIIVVREKLTKDKTVPTTKSAQDSVTV
jgi:hypothetical protein